MIALLTLLGLLAQAVPDSVDALHADVDPRREPLEVETLREWEEPGLVLRRVRYRIGTFKGEPARMAAFYGFPKGGSRLPSLVHLHGGGQRAFLQEVREGAARGYACLSINWGGRPMEEAPEGEPGTDWGAVDPTQRNVPGYSSLRPGPRTLDAVESPRNNNWFLLTIGARRGITFLERQPEVDPERIGVYGHSMGGELTVLTAGTDPRVKAAVPSVGGSGFLYDDLWGIPGSARPLDGNLDLHRRTLATELYLAKVRCPILFLSSTNDFNAPMEFVVRGMAGVPHARKRLVFAPHLNHRFTPESQVARRLWLDAHLRGGPEPPASPQVELLLNRPDGVPLARVKAAPGAIRAELYYGYDRDPRVRFWADAGGRRDGDAWEAPCPIADLDEPLFVLANVHYALPGREDRDPETFVLSAFTAAYPATLRRAGVKATEAPRRQIDDFSRGLRDWYVLSGDNRHHWTFATRKPADPRWRGPRGASLAFATRTTAPGNRLAVRMVVNEWRSYMGRPRGEFVASVDLPEAGRREVSLSAGDFRAVEGGAALPNWDEVTELSFLAADKAKGGGWTKTWEGAIPVIESLRWDGGEYAPPIKPWPAKAVLPGAEGDFEDAFRRAIERSLEQERRDRR
jgi:dienelactone hydrolase